VKGNGLLELIIPVFGGTAYSWVMEGLGRASDMSCNIDFEASTWSLQWRQLSDVVFGGISYGWAVSTHTTSPVAASTALPN